MFNDLREKITNNKKQDPNKSKIRNSKSYFADEFSLWFSNLKFIWFLRFGSWFLVLYLEITNPKKQDPN